MPIINIEQLVSGVVCKFLTAIFITCVFAMSYPAYADQPQDHGGSFSILHSKNQDTAISDPCLESDHLGSHHSGFSLISENKSDCRPNSQKRSATTRLPEPTSEPFNPEFVQTQMAGIAAIHFGRVYGGTTFLRNLWYTGALVIPHFMERDEVYGIGKNYLAITPPFLALGLLNNYLSNDGATEGRIFLSNLIGFNLALLWKDKVLSEPQHFLSRSFISKAVPNNAALQPYVLLSRNGPLVGIHFAW